MKPWSSPYEQEVAPATGSIRRARQQLRRVLASWSVPTRQIDDLVLIHSELVTNAVQQGTNQAVHVVVERTSPQLLTLAVSNRGSLDAVPDQADWHPQTVLARSGRGLMIVKALSRDVTVASAGDVVSVTSHYSLDT